MTTPKPPNIIDLTKDDKYMDKIGVPISNDNFLNMEKPPQDLKEEKDTRGKVFPWYGIDEVKATNV